MLPQSCSVAQGDIELLVFLASPPTYLLGLQACAPEPRFAFHALQSSLLTSALVHSFLLIIANTQCTLGKIGHMMVCHRYRGHRNTVCQREMVFLEELKTVLQVDEFKVHK